MTGGNKSIYHAIDDLTKIHYKKKSTAIFSKCTIVRPNSKKLTIDMQIKKKRGRPISFSKLHFITLNGIKNITVSAKTNIRPSIVPNIFRFCTSQLVNKS